MVINAVIGIMSELRAKRTLDSLAIVDAPQASVLRNGEVSVIPARDVVLDDVIELALGDQVSVDGTVLASVGLEIDESLLTGESRPVKKKEGDQLLAGTSVVAGSGRMMRHGGRRARLRAGPVRAGTRLHSYALRDPGVD